MLELHVHIHGFPPTLLAPADTPQSALPLDGRDGLCAEQRAPDAQRSFAVGKRAR
jgi:hypothetical protein